MYKGMYGRMYLLHCSDVAGDVHGRDDAGSLPVLQHAAGRTLLPRTNVRASTVMWLHCLQARSLLFMSGHIGSFRTHVNTSAKHCAIVDAETCITFQINSVK